MAKPPSASTRLAIASPMPVVLPVTKMTLSFSRILSNFRLENRLHNFSGVHGLKRFFPFRQWPDAAGNWPHVECSGCDQPDDAFPNWPVVAEAALQCNVLLHEPIEREVNRLWSPP